MIHILICDDDTTFAHDMYKRILTLPAYSPKSMTIQCLTNANDINAELLTNCDILFLDIDLGEKNGISLARDMRRRNPEAVLIFVTNFSEYAPEGYEVDAFRYLSKTELDKKLSLSATYNVSLCNNISSDMSTLVPIADIDSLRDETNTFSEIFQSYCSGQISLETAYELYEKAS